jgi:ABC-2 type transport system permease protein
VNVLRGFRAVFYKEMLHARRDRLAIVFALMMPLMQMVILGTAIDTNVRQVPTVVFDASGANQRDGTALLGTQASRAFLDRLRNTDTYRIYRHVDSDAALNEEMVAGRARVAVKIPLTFARDLEAGRQAEVLVMVDGSDSAVGPARRSMSPPRWGSTSRCGACCRTA